MSCSRTQHSDTGEAQTRKPLGLESSTLPLSSQYIGLTISLLAVKQGLIELKIRRRPVEGTKAV